LSGRANPKLQLAASFSEPEPEARAYIQQAERTFSQVADPADIGAEGTPTLILLDRKGEVLRYWTGKLPAQGERRVPEAIQALP
jgi:hypothetical protein